MWVKGVSFELLNMSLTDTSTESLVDQALAIKILG